MLTTYEEYLYLVEGKREDASQMWQIARWLGWYEEQLNGFIKPGHKHRTPQDLFLLDGEKKPVKARKTGRLDDDAVNALTSIYEAFMNDKNGIS